MCELQSTRPTLEEAKRSEARKARRDPGSYSGPLCPEGCHYFHREEDPVLSWKWWCLAVFREWCSLGHSGTASGPQRAVRLLCQVRYRCGGAQFQASVLFSVCLLGGKLLPLLCVDALPNCSGGLRFARLVIAPRGRTTAAGHTVVEVL